MGAKPGYDAGPLSWVKHELDAALKQGAAALEAYAQALESGAHDAARLKASQAHLHQAHGALQIVGLDGVTRVTQEIEGVLADLENDPQKRNAQSIEAAQRGLRDVAVHLDHVVAGRPRQTLQLLAAYAGLLAARGGGPADPADLYFPALSHRPPPRTRSAVVLHPDEARQYLREQRARYLKGLLAFLRNDRGGAADMRAAVEAIELAQSAPAQRAFWWVSLAFFDALVHDALPAGEDSIRDAKRLCNRVEQQIRALSEGSHSVSERLMRGTLYFVARSSPASDHIRQVQQTYQLAGTVPADEPPPGGEQAAAAAAVDAARDRHARAKDAWERFATGDAASLPAFCDAAKGFSEAVAGLGSEALATLAEHIAAIGSWLAGDPSKASEAVALEQATALLLAASALEGIEGTAGAAGPAGAGALGPGFDEQARLVCSRLSDCMQGRLLRTAIDIPLLDEMSRRAQEELIAEQALSDVRAQLRAVEKALDRFFRAPSERAELAQIGAPLAQLDRALALLGEARARAALDACAAHIRRFSASDFVAEEPAFSRACREIAETLSGLATYFDAASRGAADFDAAMRPVSAPAEGEAQALEPEATVEAKLAGEHREARELVRAWANAPGDGVLKEELQKNLAAIAQDAALAADARLQAAAAGALRAIGETGARPQDVAQALAQAGSPAELPAPSAAAERVAEHRPAAFASAEAADAIEAAVDAELLAVFLEEADEVLARVQAGLVMLRSEPGAEALVDIRRAFHTLKGSGRMVGLLRMGEAAWAVEQTLNLWLQEGRGADTALLGFIAAAQSYFLESVAGMKAGGRAPDEAALLAYAEAVRRGEPAPAPPAAAVPEAPPAPAALHAVDPPDASVEIGSQRVSATLFTIFSGEAHMRLGKLKEEHETLKVHGVITDEMMRTAHTLGGIAGTVQLAALRDLAHALEQALSSLALEPLSSDEEALVEEAIDAVEAMVGEALALAEPAAAAQLVERLRHVAARASDAPPAEVMVPEEEGALHAPAAQVKPAETPPERGTRRIRDEIDAQLLPLFMEEADELVPAIAAALDDWRAAPGDAAKPQSLKRLLHTLKGSARMAGAMALGELTHHMETRIERSAPPGAGAPGLLDELAVSMDRMATLLARLKEPAAGDESAAAAGSAAGTPAAEPAAMLRVRADLVDRLVNEAGEVAIARSRIEGEVRALRGAIQDLTDNVGRLRRQLREIEIQAESQMQSHEGQAQAAGPAFDPLEFDRFTRFQEVTRMMAESVNDVQTVQQNLVHVMDSTDAALAAQARLNRDMQQDLMRVRMVPFASLAERLHRIVRQSAKELGRRASLDLRGAQVELDRSVLERITAPLEHMLRNAVAHGIEPPQRRTDAGKPATGEIRLDVSQEGNEVVLVLADDGAGLDFERALVRAREMGLPGASDNPSRAEIADYIFLPGFSTAAEVSELSGRGVGMDVVRNEVASLGGRVDVGSEPGKGTRFAIHLPLTLAVTQAVLVKSGGRTYAIPTVMVQRVMQMPKAELERLRGPGDARSRDGGEALEWQGRRYRFHELAALLGVPCPEADGARPGPALFVGSGAHSVAVHVDEIVSSGEEIVVKAVGPHIGRIAGITGATVLGSGDIVLILNPVQLALREKRPPAPPAEPAPAAPVPPLVLVVDDSLTVRKITGRLLERQGYRVATARDGVEALELLQDTVPAAMLVDVEMPRMDGFDLTRNVRGDARLAAVPIIMITSRTADKHRQYAREIGVDHYLGKPFREDELLERIARFIAEGRPAPIPPIPPG